ncbi:MAG: hydrolase [Caulobacter sp.]|nr:hydrolase [Caulobacter sp.]
MTEPVTKSATARPAATVLLVRDAGELEVLMVRRHSEAHFASALVFPGGLVDPADANHTRAVGGEALTPPERALRIAGYRELFEETGLLIGQTESGEAGGEAGVGGYAQALGVHGLWPNLDALHPFAHWITPDFAPKRFDTHFFLCGLDTVGDLVSDGFETVDAEWLAPARALALAKAGERLVIFPTRMNLERLARSRTVADALAATAHHPRVPVQPRREVRADGVFIVLDEVAGYGRREEPARAR